MADYREETLGIDDTEVEGTGLGLALSKSLVQAIGGNIVLDTMEGRGTTFWIEIATAEQPHLIPLEELPACLAAPAS